MKRFAFLVVSVSVLVLVAGGFFYWWQTQADVRALNKTLPEGVRVVKSLLGNEYGVINKIDGYEFKIPMEWKGVKMTEYKPEEVEKNRTASSIYLEGKEGSGSIVSIDAYKKNKSDVSIEEWAKFLFSDYGLSGEFKKEQVGEYNVLSVQEEQHLASAYIYFLNYSKIYVLTSRFDEFIRYIISNGRW